MNQILEGTTKVDGTPNGFDQGYAHVGSSQTSNIEKELLDDDAGPSQVGSAPPQYLPSTILAFGTFANTSNMGTWGNIVTKLPQTCAANLLCVSSKVVKNKWHRLSGEMAIIFKKLTESSKKNWNFEVWIAKEGN